MLTPRQYLTICHLLSGMTETEIAARLNVSQTSISRYVRGAYRRIPGLSVAAAITREMHSMQRAVG